ncbi:ComF family protein [Magnetospirillum molischianum]|uniref:Putative competence protein F (COMF) n=1 Tax=Magnetospirillum molischianum DSM 120 TaxID=1150626 RepID=H8FW07_MAGML|nr:ComF family protein [Magnetospirillum molischianum]CCG42545.1 putative competence protein F (COMF) [Magnetospirillum molischianum DSM 120]
MSLIGPLRQGLRVIIDAILPPVCLRCQTLVADPGTLCPACWSRVAFLSAPLCAVCGRPFEIDPGGQMVCGECLKSPPRFGRARAVLRYDDETRPLILRFKHGDRLEGAPAFARWLARAGAELLDNADLLVPVPLHRWRLAMRRYNQAAVLAQALTPLVGVETVPDLLVRRRRTVSQGHLGPDARRRNVTGAFLLPPRSLPRTEGRRIVLIDDVMTTGATVNECARVLLRGGAASVDVLTLGRVVR